jgi:hypothetical protein
VKKGANNNIDIDQGEARRDQAISLQRVPSEVRLNHGEESNRGEE